MDRAFVWMRENPQLAGLAFAGLTITALFTLLGYMMTRAGVSVRPLVFVGGFIAIVGGPQALVHLFDGLFLKSARAATATVTSPESAPVEPPRPGAISWEQVFGPDYDPVLVVDPRQSLGPVLGEALEAKLSFQRTGASALAARFPSKSAAERALDRYGKFFLFAGAYGNDEAGWTARRHNGGGEWVHVVSVGPELFAWTGPDEAFVLQNRERALGSLPPGYRRDSGDQATGVKPSQRLQARPGFLVTLVTLNLLAASLWFFKGSAWAGRISPDTHVLPSSATVLRDRLLRAHPADGPVQVTQRADGKLQVDWKFEARWLDQMRAHGLKRAHRLVLSLEEDGHTVRVEEYASSLDLSAGAGGGELRWSMLKGIQFFEVRHERVLGVQLDERGRPTGDFSAGYRFDLQAMKAPLIEAARASGWTWQPVTWNAPASLRWLVE